MRHILFVVFSIGISVSLRSSVGCEYKIYKQRHDIDTSKNQFVTCAGTGIIMNMCVKLGGPRGIQRGQKAQWMASELQIVTGPTSASSSFEPAGHSPEPLVFGPRDPKKPSPRDLLRTLATRTPRREPQEP